VGTDGANAKSLVLKIFSGASVFVAAGTMGIIWAGACGNVETVGLRSLTAAFWRSSWRSRSELRKVER
jgi:hypothetical protein